VPQPWIAAMERSLDFLLAHQNPADGRLPNFGGNDGGLPAPLTACDFSDFRPLLQALSVVTRGERLYEAGPWDAECAWLFGARALDDAPLRRPRLRSRSFRHTGFHVLRGHDEGTFAAFRCGALRDRFSQCDMLALDVWWRGLNVIVDPGSYSYNGPAIWHDHFYETASHSTVAIDGRDQMLHARKFKNLYWTPARLLRAVETAALETCDGEHSGYRRHPGACVHRRTVHFARDDAWIVVDRISGRGEHDVRLHWLAAPGPHAYDGDEGRLTLDTPAGAFSVTVLGADGRPLRGDVVAGREDPPRGWLSRYYGEKVAAPSLAVHRRGSLPATFVTLLCAGVPDVRVEGDRWTVGAGQVEARFSIAGSGLAVAARAPRGRRPATSASISSR
jgi:asparagine synthase (glutamine-hydrolysing)